MVTSGYWRPEPRRHGFAWWALLIPAVLYSAGVIVYARGAFVPNATQANGQGLGSALMVLGGEAGTLMAASEVFRKSRNGETVLWDWAGMVVSLIATLGNLFVVYTALTSLAEPWVIDVRRYGPLVLLLCSALDFYANVMEFGFFNASFDARWEAWNDAKHAWEQTQATRQARGEPAAVRASVRTDPVDALDACDHAIARALAEGEDAAYASHASEHAFVCDYCGRNGFASPQALSAHLRFCDAYQAQKARGDA